MIGKLKIKHLFGFHIGTKSGPDPSVPKHQILRQGFEDFGNFLDEIVPDGDSKNAAIFYLKNAGMWANFAVSEKDPLEKNPVHAPWRNLDEGA